MSNQALSIITTDIFTFIEYLRKRRTHQLGIGNIEAAELTTETIKACESWYINLKESVAPTLENFLNNLENRS